MTTHKIIYAWGDYGPDSVTGQWSANTFYDESAEPYVPIAAIAAAYDVAAGKMLELYGRAEYVVAIKLLTPPDALAALERTKQEAKNEALEKAALAAYEFRDGRGLEGTGCIPDQIAAAIRAMKEPEE